MAGSVEPIPRSVANPSFQGTSAAFKAARGYRAANRNGRLVNAAALARPGAGSRMFNRTSIGFVAIVLLVIGAGMGLTQSARAPLRSNRIKALKMGLIFAAGWLAYDDVARLPKWLIPRDDRGGARGIPL